MIFSLFLLHIVVGVLRAKILVSSEILIKNCLFSYSMFCTFSEISIQKGAGCTIVYELIYSPTMN